MASSPERSTRFRDFVIVFVIGLLVGFVPMWLRARQRTTERDQTLQKLQTSELKDQLSAAALDSRRGQYETARQELSAFFNSLDAVMNRKNDRDITPEKLKSIEPTLSQRDNLITLLARSDPASADRLSDLDLAFRKAVR
jgi:uncharacterized membrane-anchored protein YhcB (DUF1043 family)